LTRQDIEEQNPEMYQAEHILKAPVYT